MGRGFASRVLIQKMLPLSDTLVLDLTQVIAGPTAGQILGDMGADVIKVEPLHGEHFRPHFGGAWVPSMNRNKRGLAVDLRTAGGREVLMRLARKADVFMEAFTPGVIDKLGFGWEKLSKENPRLIYASVSGYGQTGPYSSPRRLRSLHPGRDRPDGCDRSRRRRDVPGRHRGRSTIRPARSAPPASPSPCWRATRPAAASASTCRCSMSACT